MEAPRSRVTEDNDSTDVECTEKQPVGSRGLLKPTIFSSGHHEPNLCVYMSVHYERELCSRVVVLNNPFTSPRRAEGRRRAPPQRSRSRSRSRCVIASDSIPTTTTGGSTSASRPRPNPTPRPPTASRTCSATRRIIISLARTRQSRSSSRPHRAKELWLAHSTDRLLLYRIRVYILVAVPPIPELDAAA